MGMREACVFRGASVCNVLQKLSVLTALDFTLKFERKWERRHLQAEASVIPVQAVAK